ncbi:hypothetical protein GCM10023175_36830 [Pseudonocardia xishanensis]|uniref:Uncharacterized protein n=1 Tax=Pseudonocardia xishanensis TaxID=630995 RepID=A0ABP8RV26_9PSEU
MFLSPGFHRCPLCSQFATPEAAAGDVDGRNRAQDTDTGPCARPTLVGLWTGWFELKRSGVLAAPRLVRDYLRICGPRSGGST